MEEDGSVGQRVGRGSRLWLVLVFKAAIARSNATNRSTEITSIILLCDSGNTNFVEKTIFKPYGG